MKHMTPEEIEKLAADPRTSALVADLVMARIAFWNATRRLELHCGHNFNGFEDAIEGLAVTCDTCEEVLRNLDRDHNLDEVLAELAVTGKC